MCGNGDNRVMRHSDMISCVCSKHVDDIITMSILDRCSGTCHSLHTALPPLRAPFHHHPTHDHHNTCHHHPSLNIHIHHIIISSSTTHTSLHSATTTCESYAGFTCTHDADACIATATCTCIPTATRTITCITHRSDITTDVDGSR